MSYILDALKKENGESNPVSPLPDTATTHMPEKEHGASFRWGVLLCVAILGAVLIGFYLGRGTVNQPTQQATSTPNVNAQLAQSQVEPVTPDNQKESLAVERIAAEDYFDNPPEVKLAAAPNMEAKPAEEKPKEIIVGMQPQEQESSENKNVNIQLKPEDGVSPELLQLVQSAIDETATQNQNDLQTTGEVDYSNVPGLSELAASFQQRVPSLNFTLHMATTNGESWVRVNGKDVSEGQRITGDLTLVKVEVQHVVLMLDSTMFKLPAMTQW